MGIPFIGPAGKLLDRIIQRASLPSSIRLAFTNVIACVPLDDENAKTDEPPAEAIEACAPRLEEFVAMADPRLIVCVGKCAENNLAQGYKHSIRIPARSKLVTITHPAAILRANTANRTALIQKAVVVINNAVEDL